MGAPASPLAASGAGSSQLICHVCSPSAFCDQLCWPPVLWPRSAVGPAGAELQLHLGARGRDEDVRATGRQHPRRGTAPGAKPSTEPARHRHRAASAALCMDMPAQNKVFPRGFVGSWREIGLRMPNPSSTLLLAGLALALVAAAHGGPVGPGWEARRPAAADPAGRPAPVPQRVHARASICRLRGGSSRIDIDDNCAIDPTRLAGVGIGLKKDKVGNHVVVSLAKGWPAAESCEIMTGDILLEVDEMPVAPLSTTALVQTMRGVEGSQVKLLLQRGEDADLFEVTLERVLQGIVDPADPPKKSYIESTIDMGLSMGGKATSILGLSGASKPPAPAPEKLGGVAGVGIGFSCDEEANFVVSKLVAGGPAALSKQIKPGDVLLSVDGMELDDMSIKELVKVLKGPVGTSVELHFSRGGEMLSIALTRNHAAAGASKSGSIAAGIFNTVSGLASTSMSSISSTAGEHQLLQLHELHRCSSCTTARHRCSS
jgi:hypothetical protein